MTLLRLLACVFVLAGAAGADLIFQASGNIVNLQSSANLGVDFDYNGTNDLVFDRARRMGLLTAAPSANLHVAGNMRIDTHLVLPPQSVQPSAASGSSLVYAYQGNAYFTTAGGAGVLLSGNTAWIAGSGNASFSPGRVGLGTATPSANLHVMGNVLLTDRLFLGAGSATAPSLAFANETSTGLYRPASGNVAASLGGVLHFSAGGSNLVLDNLGLKTDRYLGTDYNTFIGYEVAGAGSLSHSAGGDAGWYNTGVGYQALRVITTGYANTAVGYQALKAITSGNRNTAVGSGAMDTPITGWQNTGVGFGVFGAATTGYANVAMGVAACAVLTSGYGNTGVGRSTLTTLTSGSYNTAAGGASPTTSIAPLNSATTAINNTAIGDRAMYTTTIGHHNIALGDSSLKNQTTGGNNTVLGCFAGNSVTTGGNLLLAGSWAGGSLTTGTFDILLGHLAGNNLTTGANNIIIGHTQNALSTGCSNWLNLGGVICGNLQVAGAAVGIGTTVPAGNLHVNGNVACAGLLPSANTTWTLGTSSQAWATLYTQNTVHISDRRLKTDVRPLDRGLAEVLRLRPVRFQWKDGGGEQVGFIAQEVAEVLPEAVSGPEEPVRAMRHDAIVSVLARATQEQDTADAEAIRRRQELLRGLEARQEELLRAVRAVQEAGQ